MTASAPPFGNRRITVVAGIVVMLVSMLVIISGSSGKDAPGKGAAARPVHVFDPELETDDEVITRVFGPHLLELEKIAEEEERKKRALAKEEERKNRVNNSARKLPKASVWERFGFLAALLLSVVLVTSILIFGIWRRRVPADLGITKLYYDVVGNEMKANELDQGVWARALVESNGNEGLAKALYIRRRVAELAAAGTRAHQPLLAANETSSSPPLPMPSANRQLSLPKYWYSDWPELLLLLSIAFIGSSLLIVAKQLRMGNWAGYGVSEFAEACGSGLIYFGVAAGIAPFVAPPKYRSRARLVLLLCIFAMFLRGVFRS